MSCRRCGPDIVGVRVIDEQTAEVRCALCGPAYIFRDVKAGWEYPEERMARMRREHVCQECGAVFHDYKDSCGGCLGRQ
jgi:hypothetical protein